MMPAQPEWQQPMHSPAAIRPDPLGRDVIRLGLAFAATLFLVSSVIWGFAGIDPVQSALPKVVGISADAVMAVAISLVLWRMAASRLGVKALVACILSLAGATVSAMVDRGLQIHMTRPDAAPFDPQYFASVLTFTTAELFGWSCLYLALQYNAQIRETEQRLAKARQQATEAQLRALQYQVNPHFLFNTLNSVAGLIEEGSPAPARDMVLRLAGFLHRTLALDPLTELPLGEEIALQRDYLQIEKVRFSDRLTVMIALDPSVAQALVPALVLQPLIENAIRHGVARTPGQARLDIIARPEGKGRMLIRVENPTPAGDDSPAPGMGIGLRNVAARLAAAHPDGATSCEICAIAPGRLRVDLQLPLRR
ncbi:sensor histidine kinase [Paracoccus sp. (in: a-proteobacteria)]|uniref:sensor histidine kinase n=1 Tax=Paracoccus sp. TaxID=267 RepID=UPI003A8A354F